MNVCRTCGAPGESDSVACVLCEILGDRAVEVARDFANYMHGWIEGVGELEESGKWTPAQKTRRRDAAIFRWLDRTRPPDAVLDAAKELGATIVDMSEVRKMLDPATLAAINAELDEDDDPGE